MAKSRKSKRKLRVAFRKNREKRARRKDLTRQHREEEAAVDDLAAGERVSGKGALTRHRTVIVEDDEHRSVLDVDESVCRPGRVVASGGAQALVEDDAGRRFECTVRRVVRTLARDGRNVIVTGDRVLFQPTGEGEGVVERVEPRRGVLSRTTRGREHVLVANVDRVLVIASAADPALKPNLIDRFLVSAEKGEVDAIVCINKCDLADPVELQPIAGLYAGLGYPVVLTSARTGLGLERLRRLLEDRESVLAGQSGVGKSSLLNALEPELALATDRVSEWTRKGRHTTRRAVLYPLSGGGSIADTPGIRQFALWDVLPEEVEGFFREFRPFVALCRFPDCLHVHEDGCGVKAAAERSMISPIRYESYLRIVGGDTV